MNAIKRRSSEMKLRLAYLGVILLFASTMFAQRLPVGAMPQHYQLTFTPDFNTNTFAGEEIIEITLTKPANSITMNAAELKFNSVSIEVGKASLPAKAFFDADREMATINAGQQLRPGLVRLHISFTVHTENMPSHSSNLLMRGALFPASMNLIRRRHSTYQ